MNGQNSRSPAELALEQISAFPPPSPGIAYDVRHEGDRPRIVATALFLFGCVWTLIGVFMLTAPGVRWMGLLWTALSLAFTVAIVHQELVGRPKLRAALENGACKRVEGAVERFSPLPRRDWGRGNRARWEEFYVDGVRFAYDDHPVSSAYIKIAARGGPIRAGLRVRIQYVSFPDRPTKWQPQRNVILHLEILK